MSISNATENRKASSYRRAPFIGIGEPRDVPDLPFDDETAPPPPEAEAQGVDAPQVIAPKPPPENKGNKRRFSWQWGLIGLGVLAAAGYGGAKLYQGRQTVMPGDVMTGSHPVLNSTAALNSPRAAARPPQPASEPPPSRARSLGTAAPARSEAPPQATERASEGAPADPVPAAPSPPSATEIVTENRKIVASPMMGDDQRQVLDLMAATNSVVLQLKHQVDEDGKRMRDMQAQLDEMKQMVSLSQARLLSAASQIAMGNIQPAPQPAPPPVAAPAPQPGAARSPDMGPACRLKPAYVVASASPAHATLKSGGQVFIDVTAPSQTSPQGDSIPCYGRVLKITQEGSRWVVITERDVIGRN